MIVNGSTLFELSPIEDMLDHKAKEHGVSHGLAEAGYDIRVAQEVHFVMNIPWDDGPYVYVGEEKRRGRFAIASTIERFTMPKNLVGVVHDKSTWARHGLSVFNTVIEPGWYGYLTLELVYHGQQDLLIPKGAGIAQVLFSTVAIPGQYSGKYQGQENRPVEAIMEKG